MNYLDRNIRLIRDMSGENMENSFKNISGLKKMLLEINKVAKGIPEQQQLYNPVTGRNIIRYDNIRTTQATRVSDREKYLLQLLVIVGAIRRVSIYELPEGLKQKYVQNNDFRAYLYEVMDMRNAKFYRLRALKKDKQLHYSVVRLIYGRYVADEAFKRFTPNGYYYFDSESLEDIVNYIWASHTATIEEVAEWYLKYHRVDPELSGKLSEWTYDQELKYIIDMLRALDDVGYWKKYDIKIKQNSKVRRHKRQDLNGNKLVFTEEKTTQKNTFKNGNS